MGTIAIYRNVRIVIYSNDHGPPHVHAIGPGVEATFLIETLELRYCNGINAKTIFRIRQFLGERRESLLEAWYEIHPKEKE
jgi:hypothetical protein